MANFEITYEFVIPRLGLVARRFAGWCRSVRQSVAAASRGLFVLGYWRLEAESLDSGYVGFFVFAVGGRHSLPIFRSQRNSFSTYAAKRSLMGNADIYSMARVYFSKCVFAQFPNSVSSCLIG